ncbi:hypothetical protein QA649_37540 [Bradyrhizobium sp. CB1717]|uniref:hypothetical protein n=1 Tax=Bradyrhizobium sp. CB1717 TaxID=3039154 RepID=UPI0024B20458|nr:hypothetical protein [Bradyrhizobium sp. CB1717]WFU23655.1 hypothetical protein QA649_37540 [Bradyrhizobium sp. CB1717]
MKLFVASSHDIDRPFFCLDVRQEQSRWLLIQPVSGQKEMIRDGNSSPYLIAAHFAEVELSRYDCTKQFATKRRAAAQYLDFAERRAKYVGMIIIALDQRYCVEDHLQIGK